MYIEPRLPDHTDIWTANLKSRIVHCFGEIEENMAGVLLPSFCISMPRITKTFSFTLTVMVAMLLQVLLFTIPCSIYKATFVPFALVKP